MANLLNGVQIANRIKAIIQGQKAADSLNGCLSNVQAVFDNCGSKALRVSICQSLKGIYQSMIESLLSENDFDLTEDHFKQLELIVTEGPIVDNMEQELISTRQQLVALELIGQTCHNGLFGYLCITRRGFDLYTREKAIRKADTEAKTNEVQHVPV